MIDADHFKNHDRFGHQAGDECLRSIALTLSAQVSRPADLVARFGGEEFAILLPNTPLEGAQYVAEGARAAIARLAIAIPGRRNRAVTRQRPRAARHGIDRLRCAGTACQHSISPAGGIGGPGAVPGQAGWP